MKILTIFLMALGMVLAAAYSDASDEGPTVIIVGPENDRKTTSDDWERQIEQTTPEEESPGNIGTENENPDDRDMDEPEPGMESQDTEEPEEE